MNTVVERHLVDAGVPFVEREALFVRLHPEWHNRTNKLAAVYVTCQGDRLGPAAFEFQAALQHATECAWCRQHLGL